MTERRILVSESKILILGLAFKENCPDLRNSKVVDIVTELAKFDANVDVYDPWVDADSAEREYGIRPIKAPKAGSYDAVVLAVAHNEFKDMGVRKVRQLAKKSHVLYDVKYLFAAEQSDGRL
jgi:UDP-N-acetyl-D-galactosamine dehydrogenase